MEDDGYYRSTKSTTTLDVAEDCLNEIHHCRTSILQDKMRQFARRLEHQKKRKMVALKNYQQMNAILDDFGTKGKVEDAENDDLVDNSIFDKYAEMLNSQAVIQPPTFTKSERKVGSKSVSLSITDKYTFDSMSSPMQQQDREVVSIFTSFREELQSWWTNEPLRRHDYSAREEYADYLTDKYMCQKLDPLPTTKVVSNMRKEISRIIDAFASKEELTADFHEAVFKIDASSIMDTSQEVMSSVAKTTDQLNTVAINTIGSKLPEKSAKLAEKFAGDAAAGSKKEQERLKIKQQYEAYMATKGKKLNEDAKQYEDLNDDIRSLIKSLQK